MMPISAVIGYARVEETYFGRYRTPRCKHAPRLVTLKYKLNLAS